MFKKYLVTTVAMLAAVSMLAACGNKNNEENNTTPTVTVAPTEAPSSDERGEGPTPEPTVAPTVAPEATVDHAQMVQNIYQAVVETYGSAYLPEMQVQGEAYFMQDTLKLDASWYDAAIVEIPMMSNNGNAIVSKPANTSPNSTIGRNTMKNTSFVIPHAALIPNNSNLPNIHIIQIKNNNSNNTISPFYQKS